MNRRKFGLVVAAVSVVRPYFHGCAHRRVTSLFRQYVRRREGFFDNWSKFDLFRERKMRNKVGSAFATGGSISNGKQMIVVSATGGFGASATTGPDSPGIDDKEMAEARDLGKRVAEVAALVKRGSGK